MFHQLSYCPLPKKRLLSIHLKYPNFKPYLLAYSDVAVSRIKKQHVVVITFFDVVVFSLHFILEEEHCEPT